jgi:hypothetical protein
VSLQNARCVLSLRPLVICLGLALDAQASPALANWDTVATLTSTVGAHVQLPGIASTPDVPSSTFLVQNCNDAGQGSLREAVNAANMAGMDATIQFDTNAMMGCSTITLSTGEIGITLDNLIIDGPPTQKITIEGGAILGHSNRVLSHTGVGTLRVNHLSIANSTYHANGPVRGGCIRSAGKVSVDHSTITGCTALSDSSSAGGGAIFASDTVFVTSSTLFDNQAVSPTASGGGAIYAAVNAIAIDSTFSGNSAVAPSNLVSLGGAIEASGGLDLIRSTLDHNTANRGGAALFSMGGSIYNSTVSTNSSDGGAAISCEYCDALAISNSTIAFNVNSNLGHGGGVFFVGTHSASTLELTSTIVARNSRGGSQAIADDIYVLQNVGLLSGAKNLVISSNTLPPGVIVSSEDPMLEALQLNGGLTETHQLSRNSPAIAAGVAATGTLMDQRGRGYPRWTGASYAVDIGAVQFDTIFHGDFDDN